MNTNLDFTVLHTHLHREKRISNCLLITVAVCCSLCEIFPARAGMNATIPCDADLAMTRTALEQGGYQMAALCMTLVIAIVGGALTGNAGF